jgi:hypothetical protein
VIPDAPQKSSDKLQKLRLCHLQWRSSSSEREDLRDQSMSSQCMECTCLREVNQLVSNTKNGIITSVGFSNDIQGPCGQTWEDLYKVFQEMELVMKFQISDNLFLGQVYTHEISPDLILICCISISIGSGKPGAWRYC